MKHENYLVKSYKLKSVQEKKNLLESKMKKSGDFSEKIRKSIVGICISGFCLHVLGWLLSLPILIAIALLGCMPCVVILGPIQMISESISEKYKAKVDDCDKTISLCEEDMAKSMLQLPAPKVLNNGYDSKLHSNATKKVANLTNIRY